MASQSTSFEPDPEQLQFVNREILETLRAIISDADQTPIIILQSDHGSGSMLDWNDVSSTDVGERLSILNAYLLPGDAGSKVYNTITPVNSFRLILDEYLGESFPLLSDVSYFSPWPRPYDFTDVTDRAIVEATQGSKSP